MFLIGGVLADVLVNHVHHSIYVTVLAETALTLAYAAFAAVLRDILKFSPRRTNLSGVISMLSAVPVGAVATSTDLLRDAVPDRIVARGPSFLRAAPFLDRRCRRNHCDHSGGDSGVHPFIESALELAEKRSAQLVRLHSWFVPGVRDSLHSASERQRVPFVLPSVFANHLDGMRAGYVGVAIALLATQTALFLTASYIGLDANDFDEFQILMLVLSITGLLLGAVVTERERANLLLREQQTELARVSAHATAGAMGMLLAHELSQPLSTVATYTLAARRMLRSGAGSEPVIAASSKAEAEMQRTREVLERIRDFVSAGKMEWVFWISSRQPKKSGRCALRRRTARGVDVAVESIRPVPLVKADKVGIEQVLNNIVGNAVDAAAERGDARGRVVIRVIGRGDWAIVQIDDNGRGVAPGDGGEFIRGLPNVQAARNGAWAHIKSANRAKARRSALVATPCARGDPVCGRVEHRWTRQMPLQTSV